MAGTDAEIETALAALEGELGPAARVFPGSLAELDPCGPPLKTPAAPLSATKDAEGRLDPKIDTLRDLLGEA